MALKGAYRMTRDWGRMPEAGRPRGPTPTHGAPMRTATLLTFLALSLTSCAGAPQKNCASCSGVEGSEPLARENPTNLEELLGEYHELTGENLTYDAVTAEFLRSSKVTRVGPSEAEVLLIRVPTSDSSAQASSPEAEIIALEYASASDLALILRQLIQDAAGTGGPGSSGAESPDTAVTIVADGATNSLLLRASPTRLVELKELIARLDVEATENG